MANENSLESLSHELFTAILDHISSPSELATLCLVSTNLYNRVVPKLYHEFTYHGKTGGHDSRSLKTFFNTMMWRYDLAAMVQVLDIGEWGDCPLLKDHVGMGDEAEAEEESEGGDPWENDEGEDVEMGEAGDEPGEGGDPWDEDESEIGTGDLGGGSKKSKIESENENEQEDVDENEDEDQGGEWGPDAEVKDWAQIARDRRARAEERAKWRVPWPEYFKVSKSDDGYSDFEPSDSGSDTSTSDISDPEPDSDYETEQNGFLGPSDPQKYREVSIYDVLRAEANALGFAYEDFLGDYWAAAWDKENEPEDEVVLGNLIPLLRNLKTLYLMPIDDMWEDTPRQKHPVRDTIVQSLKEGGSPILQNLETLCMASSLHIGPKGHREYELQLYQFLPFLQLPSLRCLKTLTPYTTYDGSNFPIPDLSPYFNTSNLTSLVLDECELVPRDSLALLAVPKALSYLRWTQDLDCHSIGACNSPFHARIGVALQKHRRTLTELDLDIRQKYCDGRGHRGNPFATQEQLRAVYDDPSKVFRSPQDSILIGSLRSFTGMKILSIDATALCGHQSWAKSPLTMVELLPPNLHALNLRVHLKGSREGRPVVENELWMDHVFDLLKRKDGWVKGLRRVGVRVARKVEPWEGVRWWVEGSVKERETWLWKGLKKEAEGSGVEFYVEDEEDGTKEEWFVGISEERNPGRDW